MSAFDIYVLLTLEFLDRVSCLLCLTNHFVLPRKLRPPLWQPLCATNHHVWVNTAVANSTKLSYRGIFGKLLIWKNNVLFKKGNECWKHYVWSDCTGLWNCLFVDWYSTTLASLVNFWLYVDSCTLKRILSRFVCSLIPISFASRHSLTK
jgi:hypothetical protein